MTVFQRTGNWFLPRRNRPYPRLLRAAYEHVPGLQEWRRKFVFEYGESLTMAIRHPRTVGRFVGARSYALMRLQLRDPELRRAAWPDYTFGCKRVLFSSHFLPALGRPNVELVTEPIARMSSAGIITGDGREHAVDCVIWATGFRTNDFMLPMEICGSGGRELRESWSQGAHAHLGMTVPGFPNGFLIVGPNTGLGNNSIVFMIEAQIRYVIGALEAMAEHDIAALEVRPELHAAFQEEVQRRMPGSVWTDGGCRSWYLDRHGRNSTLWPDFTWRYALRTRRFDLDNYRARLDLAAQPLASAA